MEFKGTKGKWQKMSATQMGVPYIIFVGNETIFQCYGENALENTNLVIKAPEMLEMLIEQLNLIKSILRIKSLWLPKEPLSAEFSAEYISLSSMLNKLEEQEYQIKQLIKEATTI
jgi:hypothetical protein